MLMDTISLKALNKEPGLIGLARTPGLGLELLPAVFFISGGTLK